MWKLNIYFTGKSIDRTKMFFIDPGKLIFNKVFIFSVYITNYCTSLYVKNSLIKFVNDFENSLKC